MSAIYRRLGPFGEAFAAIAIVSSWHSLQLPGILCNFIDQNEFLVNRPAIWWHISVSVQIEAISVSC
jgi:hypothetical protein